jgi:hypothetical protein
MEILQNEILTIHNLIEFLKIVGIIVGLTLVIGVVLLSLGSDT